MRRPPTTLRLLALLTSALDGCTAVVSLDDFAFDTTPACGESPCRLVAPQCGCASGEACYPAGVGGAPVCSRAGSLDEGAICASDGDCAAGLSCFRLEGAGSTAFCLRHCGSDADCVIGGARCVLFRERTPGVRWCSLGCDPARSLGCASTTACHVFRGDASGASATHCLGPVGAATQGAPCAEQTDCASGYRCGPGESSGVVACRRYCDLAGERACPGTSVCRADEALRGSRFGLCE